MEVFVVVATDGDNKINVCEVFEDKLIHAAYNRFAKLCKIYGGANVCIASRKVKQSREIIRVPIPFKNLAEAQSTPAALEVAKIFRI